MPEPLWGDMGSFSSLAGAPPSRAAREMPAALHTKVLWPNAASGVTGERDPHFAGRRAPAARPVMGGSQLQLCRQPYPASLVQQASQGTEHPTGQQAQSGKGLGRPCLLAKAGL